MKRLSGVFGSSASSARSSTTSLTALEEPQQLEDAMRATMYLIDDDVDTAYRLLKQGNSPFHKVRGTPVFEIKYTSADGLHK